VTCAQLRRPYLPIAVLVSSLQGAPRQASAPVLRPQGGGLLLWPTLCPQANAKTTDEMKRYLRNTATSILWRTAWMAWSSL
jgi:hypothetical protein